jgi:hypothetical protein
VPVTADWVGSKECPVSLISQFPQIDVLVDEIVAASIIKEGTGGVMYGSDPSKWDCRWYDATVEFIHQERLVDAAITKATG